VPGGLITLRSVVQIHPSLFFQNMLFLIETLLKYNGYFISMALICGLDESGRGPVIGPLVICAVAIAEKEMNKLESLGVRDSKLLSPKSRVLLAPKIKNVVKKHETIIIQPEEIDSAVLSDTLNLNWLEAIKTAELINKINPDRVILDCPSNNRAAYVNYLERHLRKKVGITAEHKADVKYPIVAAASIIAKVTRDNEIEKLKKKHKVNFGSGYPADPITKEFIKKNYHKYNFFRKSWATFQEASNAKKQAKLGDFN